MENPLARILKLPRGAHAARGPIGAARPNYRSTYFAPSQMREIRLSGLGGRGEVQSPLRPLLGVAALWRAPLIKPYRPRRWRRSPDRRYGVPWLRCAVVVAAEWSAGIFAGVERNADHADKNVGAPTSGFAPLAATAPHCDGARPSGPLWAWQKWVV